MIRVKQMANELKMFSTGFHKSKQSHPSMAWATVVRNPHQLLHHRAERTVEEAVFAVDAPKQAC